MDKNLWLQSPKTKSIVIGGKKLTIGWDADTDPLNLEEWSVTMCYGPDDNNEYIHIKLNQNDAKSLYNWLGKFFKKVK